MRQIHVIHVQGHFPRLDLRQVQDIVEQAHQGLAAIGDQLGMVALPFRQVAFQQQVRKAHHAVHGRADFVAHAGEEFALCARRPACLVARIDELVAKCNFLRTVGENAEKRARLTFFVGFDQCDRFGVPHFPAGPDQPRPEAIGPPGLAGSLDRGGDKLLVVRMVIFDSLGKAGRIADFEAVDAIGLVRPEQAVVRQVQPPVAHMHGRLRRLQQTQLFLQIGERFRVVAVAGVQLRHHRASMARQPDIAGQEMNHGQQQSEEAERSRAGRDGRDHGQCEGRSHTHAPGEAVGTGGKCDGDGIGHAPSLSRAGSTPPCTHLTH